MIKLIIGLSFGISLGLFLSAMLDIQRDRRRSKWIRCKDRLPKDGERVLATDGYFTGEAYFANGVWYRIYMDVDTNSSGWKGLFERDVTCWLYLNDLDT